MIPFLQNKTQQAHRTASASPYGQSAPQQMQASPGATISAQAQPAAQPSAPNNSVTGASPLLQAAASAQATQSHKPSSPYTQPATMSSNAPPVAAVRANPSQQAPAAAPAPKPEPETKAAGSAWDQLTKQYQDIQKAHGESWAQKQGLAEAQISAFQRRADAMNAQSGRSAFGGGAMGTGRQGLLQGMQHMSAERAKHDEQGRKLQLAWLDKQIQQANRDQDFGRQQELMALQQQFAARQAGDARAHEIDLMDQELSATLPGYRSETRLGQQAEQSRSFIAQLEETNPQEAEAARRAAAAATGGVR